MKKISFILSLIAAFALFSCEKQPLQDTPREGSYIFSLQATSENIDTKTDYTDGGVFSWSANDCISVLFNNGSEEKFFSLKTADSGSSATFTGSIDDGYNIGGLTGKKWALYPASPIPMMAIGTSDNEFAFKQLGPAYRFTFTGIPDTVSKVMLTVSNTNGAGLCGNVSISYDKYIGNYNHFLNFSNSTSSTEAVSFTCNVSADHSAVFYVPVRYYGSYTPTLTLTNAVSNEVLITKTATKASTLTGAKVKRVTIPVTGGVWAYTPKFNVWEGAASTVGHTHSSGTHITSLKACADASYLYLYLEMNEAFFPLTSSFATESLLQFAIKDDNGSADWKFGSDKINLTWLCWLASNGSFAVSAYKSCALFNDAKIESHGGVVYAEIQIKRSAISNIQSDTESSTGVGVSIFPGWNNNAENWNGYTWAPDGSLLTIYLPAYSAL